MNNDQCPTPERLRQLIDGALSESETAAMRPHVDGCSECQKVLEGLVAGTESWDMAIGHLRKEGLPMNESPLSEAVRRLKDGDFHPPHTNGRAAVSNPNDYLSPSDEPGSIGKLGSYEVTEVIGQGGMGVVLRAYDPTLHRVVAVKVLAPYLANNPSARKRFVREAQAIAAVIHDHVITIHAIDETAEQPKIVMQYVTGCNLQQKIDNEGSLDLKEILRIAMQTASGLAAAHAQGLVHRDIKPSNILLENGVQRVKLTDFGLARAVDDASLTQSGVISGTPQYMAPEQACGDAVDHRADLFSLGSVMYAMCVGHSPFRASTTMGVLKRVCSDPPRPIQELNPDVPAWLSAIIMKLLAKKPEDRYQSAKEVAELLEHWLACVQQPTVVRMPVVMSQPESDSAKENSHTMELNPTSTPKRKWWVIPLAILLLIFVVGPFVKVALFTGSAVAVLVVPLAAIGLIAVFLIKFLNEPVHGSNGETVRPFSERFDQAVNETNRSIRDGWGKLTNHVSVGRSKLRPTHARQFLCVAWYVCGVIELLTIPLVIPISLSTPHGAVAFILGVTFFFLPLCFAGLSIAIGNKIDRKSQLSSIRRYSLIGLLPFTMTAILRIPVAIATLIWTNDSEVAETFQRNPTPEMPNRVPRRTWAAWVRLWFFTGVWIGVWSVVCLLAGVAFYIFYAVPYGPSVYSIGDNVTLQINRAEEHQQSDPVADDAKTKPQLPPALISIHASGSGPAKGLLPPLSVFVRNKVTVNPRYHGQSASLELELTDAIRYADSGLRFTVKDCENWFSDAYQVSDTRYASKFYQLLETLKRDGGFTDKVNDSVVRNLNLHTVEDYMQFFHKAQSQKYRRYERTSPIFRTIKSMMGDELFRLAPSYQDEVIYTNCDPAFGFYAVNGIATLVWLFVSFQLIAWRHRGGGDAKNRRSVDQVSSR